VLLGSTQEHRTSSSLRSTARRRPRLPSLPPARRVARFVVGLALCAAGVWLSVEAHLGLSPWDVLHSGTSAHTGISFGTVVIAVGILVLVASRALGVRPGLGTVVNTVGIGLALDRLLATSWLDGLATAPLAERVLALLAAVVLLGFGGAVYLGAGFGAGPRDSLMVACAARGLPIGASRCAIELSVLGVGWLLGGPVGVGTLLLALGTGPAVQASFHLLREAPPGAAPARSRS
jgi:uncharacterized membrane protein YczE